jgi:polyphenol oxidase
VYRVKQVHGNAVLTASEAAQSEIRNPDLRRQATEAGLVAEAEATFPDGDGLVSHQVNQAVWVCSADCTPALIGDLATGQVAAVHAGWRGTALKILPTAIAHLQAQGSQLRNLRIALGPAIAGEVYQVSTTVAAQVGSTVLAEASSNEALEPILEAVQQVPNTPILADPQPGRARLDVRRVNQLQLERLGISPEQITIAPYCTYQTPEYFFSYRRTRQKQVQWSGIVSRA